MAVNWLLLKSILDAAIWLKIYPSYGYRTGSVRSSTGQQSTNIIADDVVGGDGMIHMIHSYNSVQDILEVVLQDDQQVVVLPDDQWGEEVLQDDHWHGEDEVQDWLYDVEEDKHNHWHMVDAYFH